MEASNSIENIDLLALLNEIEDEEADIQQAQIEADKKIEEYEEATNEQENADIEGYYGNKSWRLIKGEMVLVEPDAPRPCDIARKRLSAQNKAERIAIQRMAFDQTLLPLEETIPNEHLQRLIALLIQDYDALVNKCVNLINSRLTKLLTPLIPARIKVCRTVYPGSVRVSPGFLYKASKAFGNGLTFWATPDIPYYFPQNTEQEALSKVPHNKGLLESVDRTVVRYYKYLKKRSDKKLEFATTIVRGNVNTYFDLLRLNPIWFNILYKDIKENNNHE